MADLSFTLDLVCRQCRSVLVASCGELPEGMNQTDYEFPFAPCEDHPKAGHRLLVTVNRSALLPALIEREGREKR
jgi:hypothetical protein